MEEKRRQPVRPQIYNGEISDLAQKMEDRRRATQGETVQKQTEDHPEADVSVKAGEESSGPSVQKKETQKAVSGERKPGHRIPEKLIPSAKRKREQENLLKMRILGVILGVLVVALIFALIFEVGLGYGTKQTGKERMAAQDTAWQQEMAEEGQTGGLA